MPAALGAGWPQVQIRVRGSGVRAWVPLWLWRAGCAKANGHDPYAYLKDVLMRFLSQKARHIDQLLPHRRQPTEI